MTPAGLVLTLATDRDERGYPFAFQIKMMCQQAIMGDEAMTLPELTATRSLRDRESAAVNTVFSALNSAVRSGSGDAIMGVAQFGLPLLAKWAHYLVVIEQHPDPAKFDARSFDIAPVPLSALLAFPLCFSVTHCQPLSRLSTLATRWMSTPNP